MTLTTAWSYRLGARAQWLGASRDLLVVNQRGGPGGRCSPDHSANDFCSVVGSPALRLHAPADRPQTMGARHLPPIQCAERSNACRLRHRPLAAAFTTAAAAAAAAQGRIFHLTAGPDAKHAAAAPAPAAAAAACIEGARAHSWRFQRQPWGRCLRFPPVAHDYNTQSAPLQIHLHLLFSATGTH